MVLDSNHHSSSTFGHEETSAKRGMTTTITGTGLGLDFGNAHGHGFQSGFGVPSEQVVTVFSDLEEGVFRYQNGIDS